MKTMLSWAQRTVGARRKFNDKLMDKLVSDLDGYRTPAIAVTELVKREDFLGYVWEPANGMDDISKTLLSHGFEVYSTDIHRWVPETQTVKSFFDFKSMPMECDIITNPPYKLANDFVLHAMSILPVGGKLALLLRVQFLEGQIRYDKVYANHPVKTVYVFSFRLPRMHRFLFSGKASTSTLAFAWFVWEKGFKGDTVVKWITKPPKAKPKSKKAKQAHVKRN